MPRSCMIDLELKLIVRVTFVSKDNDNNKQSVCILIQCYLRVDSPRHQGPIKNRT
jgi:hypothetical protein